MGALISSLESDSSSDSSSNNNNNNNNDPTTTSSVKPNDSIDSVSWLSNKLQSDMAAKFTQIELLSLRQLFQDLKQSQDNPAKPASPSSSSSDSRARQQLQQSHISQQPKAKDVKMVVRPIPGIIESTFVEYLGFPADKSYVGQLFFRSFYNLSNYPDNPKELADHQQPLNLTVKDFIKPLALFCQKVDQNTLLDVNPIKVIFESFAERPHSPAHQDNASPVPSSNTDVMSNNNMNIDTNDSAPLEKHLPIKRTKTMEDSLRDLASQTNFEWNPEDDDTIDAGPSVKALDLVEIIDGLLWLIQKISNSRNSDTDSQSVVPDSHLRHRAVTMVEHMIRYNRSASNVHLPIDLASEMIDFGMFSKYITRNAPNLFEVLSQYFYSLFLIGNTLNPPEAASNKFILPGISSIPELSAPSSIITSEHLALISWFLPLKNTTPTLTMLYNGSQHGFSMNQFEVHVCKYPAPTLLLLLVERQKTATPTMNRRQSISFGNTALRHRNSISSNSPVNSSYSTIPGSNGPRSSFDKLIGQSPTTPISTGSVLSTIFDNVPSTGNTITAEPNGAQNSIPRQRTSLDNTPTTVKPRKFEKERLILGAYVTETWKVSKTGWGNDSFELFELSPCFEVFPAKKSSTTSTPTKSAPIKTGARGKSAVATGTTSSQMNRHYIHFLKNVGVGFGGQESESCMLYMDDNLRYGTYKQDYAGGNIYMNAGGARQSGFEIDFEIVECEVWGLGGAEAKARQKKEWDFEQREANRRASIHIRGKGGEQEIDMDLLDEPPGSGIHKEDPCTILARTEEPDITFTHVKDCYENIPFNATLASDVLTTLYTLYRDYYIFLDLAMLPDHPKPFTTPVVDMLEGLDLLYRQQYHGDFEFHTAILSLVNKLNDAHANYLVDCYRHYLFVQPFELYAPVVNNVQSVRILVDNSENDLEECEVLTIDGVNALDAIQNFADTETGFSKDAGVRLNKATGGSSFNSEDLQWEVQPGLFTTRASLPERQTMVYHIKCPASRAYPNGLDRVLNSDWEVYRLTTWNTFDSTDSFLQQNCYRDTDPRKHDNEKRQSGILEASVKKQSDNIWGVQAAVEPLHHNTIRTLSKNQKRQLERQEEDQIAWLIYNGTSTAFYQLASRPNIGVVVIPTHSVDLEIESAVMEQGFERLYHSGVRNIILDLTANGGGYVNFAYDLVEWMFPVENQSSVYLSDLRTVASSKALAQADLADEDYAGYYNPGSFSDGVTREDYDTNFFMQDRLIKRVKRQLDYTPQVYMNHDLGAFEMEMPWQNDGERVVILTDGTCGSACGMSLNRLKNTHGVKSYAVGGLVGEELSLFSFAGGSVYSLDSILKDFTSLGVDSPMQPLRYSGIYRVPILEFYLEGETMPIEHNPKLYKADFHLDYTPITARRHEILWEIVANNHWNVENREDDDPSIEKERQ
ncbi:hypothetical protein BGZ49_001628 [Haplosporangium sp. Z 27]|nr:hypothetical protein BGZ49_001628 [Haplosporangium sp. Z 27]